MKLKKYIYSSLLVCLSLTTNSCSDWLTLEPENDLIKEEYWQTQSDVEATLTGSYYALVKNCFSYCFMWGELRADELLATLKTSSSYQQIMSNIITSSSSLVNWSSFYGAINVANNVIAYAEGVKDVDMSFTDEECDALVAEAYFIRSLSYFYLVRAFKDVPFITEPSADDGQDYDVAKSDEMVILDAIIADMEAYQDLAYESFSTIERTKGRATKGAMNALLADMYLWRGSIKEGNGDDGTADYNLCVEACERVRSLDYTLVPGSDWFTIFYPGNSSESIFEMQFDLDLGLSNNLIYWFSTTSGYQFTAGGTVTALYDVNQDDVRGEGSTFITLDNSEAEVWKHLGTKSSTSSTSDRRSDSATDNNFIVYRLSDIYLLEAEARLLINPLDSTAEELIRSIKERASIAPGEWLPDVYEVLNERQRELAFEGKRWFDLLRYARRSEEGRQIIINLLLASVSATEYNTSPTLDSILLINKI
ncbi:MAG: RagB/SusD family nutrient uptake outer membrane protein [Rikenellaceae bacterium]